MCFVHVLTLHFIIYRNGNARDKPKKNGSRYKHAMGDNPPPPLSNFSGYRDTY